MTSSAEPHRYTSPDEDSRRWARFEYRPGDVVVSTRSKHGTTWLQTILLLLIHQQPELPAPLAQLSPWLDHLVEPLDDVISRLVAQSHRRVIKTHTPLDGIPLDSRATYVVAARHPLDAAVSLYHQGDNIDRQRLERLTGSAVPQRSGPAQSVTDWLQDWIDAAADPREELDSLPGVMWHLSDAWARRDQPTVVLVHYDDLLADVAGQMRGLAERLAIEVVPDLWADLVAAASLQSMRRQAQSLAPNAGGVLRDPQAFFRRGSSGAGAEVLSVDWLGRYHERARALAPPDLLSWLHRERGG